MFTGCPCAACLDKAVRNSTWRGAHNAPHCGTRTVLADNPLSSRAARRASWGERRKSLGPLLSPRSCFSLSSFLCFYPVTTLTGTRPYLSSFLFTCRQAHSPRRLPLIKSSCSARLKGNPNYRAVGLAFRAPSF